MAGRVPEVGSSLALAAPTRAPRVACAQPTVARHLGRLSLGLSERPAFPQPPGAPGGRAVTEGVQCRRTETGTRHSTWAVGTSLWKVTRDLQGEGSCVLRDPTRQAWRSPSPVPQTGARAWRPPRGRAAASGPEGVPGGRALGAARGCLQALGAHAARTRQPQSSEVGQRAPSHVVGLYVSLIGINSSMKFRVWQRSEVGFYKPVAWPTPGRWEVPATSPPRTEATLCLTFAPPLQLRPSRTKGDRGRARGPCADLAGPCADLAGAVCQPRRDRPDRVCRVEGRWAAVGAGPSESVPQVLAGVCREDH